MEAPCYFGDNVVIVASVEAVWLVLPTSRANIRVVGAMKGIVGVGVGP